MAYVLGKKMFGIEGEHSTLTLSIKRPFKSRFRLNLLGTYIIYQQHKHFSNRKITCLNIELVKTTRTLTFSKKLSTK